MSNKVEIKNRLLAQAFTSWSETRGLSFALLDSLSDEQLPIEFPRPVFNSLGKQFQEMGVIQGAYTKAIERRSVDYSEMDVDFDSHLVTSRTRIRQFLKDKDDALRKMLTGESDPSRIIDWELPRNPSLLEHLYWLSAHEALHHGQLIAYCYLLNIELPEVWSTSLGLPPRDPDLVFKWLEDWKRHVHKT